MRKLLLGSAVFVAAVAVGTGIAIFARQDKSKRPSPPATAKCELAGGQSITVDYSSPGKKGRRIFGDVVPYGKVWRAGANEATTFVTTADLVVGGMNVPAGKYTVFTLPEKDKWTLIVSKKTGEWGIPYPEGSDFGRVEMKVSATPDTVENFAVAFDKTANGCTLRMEWENTRATVGVAVK